ncbi:uncharacterized protein LOC124954438 isoform X3 [Vespa velutina]|uniref:uncharacterized protein LOC124954438 isoform X3 n=1 Tax=Vespa velutina TaxID=202808 RepID=UPI001FB4E9E9|nr:uncharacterized protein LOC124954438 isoform X3 [Vespa velutina]
MLRKPIRTYQRRNIPNPLIKISDFAKVDLTLKTDDILKEQYGINNVNENKLSEDSLNYDPFETTFDRIAKDAVVPAIPPDCIDNNSWSGSSSDINSEEENINESLFHISFCNSNVSVSPNMKYTKSLKVLPYKKNVKPKNKKTSITGALYNSQHTREIRSVKKKNQTKACKSKRIKKIQKTKNKKQSKSNNGGILYSVFKNSNDQLYESDIVNADINKMTNNENINNSTVPYKNIHKKNTDLLRCNKCELHSPLRKTTNISKINDKKKICRLTSIKKTQKINNENNENLSLTSSVSHNIPDSMDKFKIKPCSVVLYKNNIEKYIYNTEKIIKSEILKKEEPLTTITKEKSNEEHIENEDTIEERSHGKSMDENQSQFNMNETINFFTRLKHSVKVTERKQPDRKRNFYLSNICENENDITQYSTCEMSQYNKKVNDYILNQDPTKNVTNTSVNIITQCDEPNLLITEQIPSLSGKFIFLKPGKSWTRSLSILHNFQNGLNLNRTSTEKGKRWRHSVKDILDMQKKDECDTNQFINLKRFVRRTSIRVVCDNRIIKNASDTSFLEVYGIKTTVNNEHILPETSCNTEYSTQHNDMENNCAEICSSGTARDVILQKCSQKHYLPFRDLFSTKYLKFCRKIGEGVYGEVFLYEKDTQKSVLKIIPIEGVQLVNGESQKKFDEILSEIVIAKELHNLRFNKNHNTSGFVEVKSIKCIEGKYPEKMVNLWKKYDEEKTSDNDCPSIFDEKQLYISLELGHGGQDLESFEFHTAVEAYALFIQATLALAVAERSLKFEHRDLHWGNILISHTDEQYIYYKLDNKDISVSSNGIKVCIIDFTLSRMSYQGCCIFNDLALDPALFTAQGEYQFEIYRLMKDKVQNNWQKFEPYTNILWLHYVLDKMLTMVRYKKKNLKKHKNALIQLYNLKHVILSYQSAFDFVNNCQQISNLLIK